MAASNDMADLEGRVQAAADLLEVMQNVALSIEVVPRCPASVNARQGIKKERDLLDAK